MGETDRQTYGLVDSLDRNRNRDKDGKRERERGRERERERLSKVSDCTNCIGDRNIENGLIKLYIDICCI